MIIVGHRGARGEAPENTLAGFEHALRAGVRHFELDLQLSLDGEIMVFHDDTLTRTTGVPGKMTQWSAAALSQLQAHLPWPHAGTDTGIPRLTDVLTLLRDVEWVQLEIKSDSRFRLDRLCRQLIWLLDTHHFAEQAVVTSFNSWVLSHIKQLAPTLQTGFVTDSPLVRPVARATALGARYLIPNHRLVTPALVREAHAAGLHVSPWTVNQLADVDRVQQCGVDSVITDHPTALLHRAG